MRPVVVVEVAAGLAGAVDVADGAQEARARAAVVARAVDLGPERRAPVGVDLDVEDWPPSTLCAVAKPSMPPLNGDWEFVTRQSCRPGSSSRRRVALPVRARGGLRRRLDDQRVRRLRRAGDGADRVVVRRPVDRGRVAVRRAGDAGRRQGGVDARRARAAVDAVRRRARHGGPREVDARAARDAGHALGRVRGKRCRCEHRQRQQRSYEANGISCRQLLQQCGPALAMPRERPLQTLAAAGSGA